jgi:hypothetical protein
VWCDAGKCSGEFRDWDFFWWVEARQDGKYHVVLRNDFEGDPKQATGLLKCVNMWKALRDIGGYRVLDKVDK